MANKPTPTSRTGSVRSKGPAPSEPTSASAWKKGRKAGTLLSVPSGNVIKVKPVGMEAFLRQGTVPNGLMPLIREAMSRGEAPSEKDLAKWAEDPTMLENLVSMADNIAMACALEPRIYPVPEDESDRDEGLLYVDEVDFLDKMEIFNFAVGGSADLGKFRDEQSPAVVDVPAGEGVDSTSE